MEEGVKFPLSRVLISGLVVKPSLLPQVPRAMDSRAFKKSAVFMALHLGFARCWLRMVFLHSAKSFSICESAFQILKFLVSAFLLPLSAFVGLCIYVFYFKTSFTFILVHFATFNQDPPLLLINHCTSFSPQLRGHFCQVVFMFELGALLLCFHGALCSSITILFA